MSDNNNDQLADLRAYWLKRQRLDLLCDSIAQAISAGRGAEAPALVAEADAEAAELARLARSVVRPADEGALAAALGRGLRGLRERLAGERAAGPASVVAAFAGLAELEASLELRSEVQLGLLESLASQARIALHEGQFELARSYGLALREHGGTRSPLLLAQLTLELAPQAVAAGDLALARDYLDQVGALVAAQPSDYMTADLRTRLAAEEASLSLEQGQRALAEGSRERAIGYLEQVPPQSSLAPRAAELLRQARTAPVAPARVGAGTWMLGLALGLVILAFLLGQRFMPGQAATPTPAITSVIMSIPPQASETSIASTLAQTSGALAMSQTSIAIAAAQTPLALPSSVGTVPLSLPTATAPSPAIDDLRGRLINDKVAVYTDPVEVDAASIIALLPVGSELSLCALAGNRYLVALGACGSTTPLGWVTRRNFEPLFEGRFPAALTTPISLPAP